MPDHWRNIADHFPFVLAAGNAAAGRINPQRIAEAVIIAALSAGATTYVMTARIDERTQMMQTSFVKAMTDINARQDRTDGHVDSVDRRLTDWQLSVVQQGRKGQ